MVSPELMRRWVVAGAFVFATGLIGCANSRPNIGVLTGTVRTCTAHEHLVKVSVFDNSGGGLSERVPAKETYRFDLPPGRYLISTTDSRQQATPIVLRAGSTTT